MRSTVRATCTHEGCREFRIYQCDNARERESARKTAATWKCCRHSDLDLVLSETNPTRTALLTSRSTGAPGLYWSTGSGFTSGPGFRAWADDFPEGTQVEVTARLILPEHTRAPEVKET